MKLSLCNEVIRELPFGRQCEVAAALGYKGLELAPFTLGDETYRMPASERAAVRDASAKAGIAISGLHWLLVAPKGLSITTADRAVWERTVEVMRRLVELCADLGGDYLVHGSPAQRRVAGDTDAPARAEAAWAAVAPEAEAAGVTYCIEPLAARETDFVNTVTDAAAAAIERWMPTGLVAHIQLNDSNRRGPGEGRDAFAPVLAALKRTGYDGWIAMEPFEYIPDGPTCAARSIGYIAGIIEALEGR